jgi:UDPglucose 6-dehydrogenase
MATIAVAGLWHQGTVLAACFADMGHSVRGIANDLAQARALAAAKPVVHEPKLNTILRRNIKAGRLTFTTDVTAALTGADFAYVAMDTPVGEDDSSDLSTILEAAEIVARAATGSLTIVVTAQVPVGTCDHITELVRQANPAVVCQVAYVPEYLQLGRAVDTFRQADRFVVAAHRPKVAQRVADLYRPLGRPILVTDVRSAEMGKHACNAFLAASISFINEIANLCDEVGADAGQVARIMKLDRRIGQYAFLGAGLGFAGGTLGREIRALQLVGREHGQPTPMMDAVWAVNESRARLPGERLRRIYGSLAGRQVGIFGLTYKAGTSTLRRSIALDIIAELVAAGVKVKAYDPLARLDEVEALPVFEACDNPYAVAIGADAIVLITEWAGIQNLDLGRLRMVMRRPVFIDTRNILDPATMRAAGFEYSSIGRG